VIYQNCIFAPPPIQYPPSVVNFPRKHCLAWVIVEKPATVEDHAMHGEVREENYYAMHNKPFVIHILRFRIKSRMQNN